MPDRSKLAKYLRDLLTAQADVTATPQMPRQEPMTIGPRTGVRDPAPQSGPLAAIARSMAPSEDTPMGMVNEMFNPLRQGAAARELASKAVGAIQRREMGRAAGLGALAAMSAPGVPGSQSSKIASSLKKSVADLARDYGGQLENYISGPLYRESNIENALNMMPTRFHSAIDMAYDRPFFASAPEYALGQGANKGVLMEFSPIGLEGRVSKSKPTWEASYGSGYAEFQGQHNRQSAYQNALQSVTIKPEAQADKVTNILMRKAIKDLEERGWKREVLEDGSIKLSKPQETPQP